MNHLKSMFLKRTVSSALVFSFVWAPALAGAAPQASQTIESPKNVVNLELGGVLPPRASQTWDALARSFDPGQVKAKSDEGGWQIDFGMFPLISRSNVGHPNNSPFLGITFTKPLYTPTEIFNECPHGEFDYDPKKSNELPARIEKAAKDGDDCEAATALRTLFLSDFKTFEKIDGWNQLLRVLEHEGAVRDFNIELSQYLKYKNPKESALIEDLRFRQLKLYSRFVPTRHVNPRGTLPRTNFASEYVALIRLFVQSYPESTRLKDVSAMEKALFEDYVLKYDIPIVPVTIPQVAAPVVLVQDQKAFTPLALGISYPTQIWTASSDYIDRVLKGQESLYHSSCGCAYQPTSKDDLEYISEVDGLGYSRVASLEKAQDTCVRLAQTSAATPSTGIAYTSQCTQTEVKLDDKLIAALKADYDNAVVQERIQEEARHRVLPSYQRVLAGAFTVLFSAFTWRNRGGGPYALGSTQQARILFALLPQTLIGAVFGYIGDGWDGAKVGATAGALMTPALLIPWGRQMDVGRLNGDKWEDFALLNLRGLLQTLPAAYYLDAKGRDASPVLMGGLGMGPCYFAAWQWGANTTVAKNWGTGLVDVATAWGELCWGGSLGLGLIKSLE